MTWVYVIFILLAVIGSIFFDKKDGYGTYKLAAYRVLYLYLICIVGFSYGLGGDKFAYMGFFKYYYSGLDAIWDCIASEVVRHGFMPLWTLLCLIVKTTTDSFYVLQFALALMVNIPLCEIVRKHTDHGFIFLLLYFISETFFQFNTEVMREGPAIAFGLVAMEAFISDNRKRYWLFTLLALGFHLSACILFILPLVHTIELSRKNILIILSVTFVCWILSDKVLIPVLSYFLSHDAGAIGRKLVTYTSIQTNFFGFLRSFLSMMVVPMFAIYFNREQEVSSSEKDYRNRMTGLLILVAFVGCVFAGFTRFFNYVQIFYLIMLTELVAHLLETKLHLIFRLGTIVAAFAFWIWYEVAYWSKIDFHFYQFFVPYTCIVDETEDVFFREDAYEVVCNYSFYEDRIKEAE